MMSSDSQKAAMVGPLALADHINALREPCRDTDLTVMRHVYNIGGPSENAEHYTATAESRAELVDMLRGKSTAKIREAVDHLVQITEEGYQTLYRRIFWWSRGKADAHARLVHRLGEAASGVNRALVNFEQENTDGN